jgi:hypothetical protein
VNLKTIVAVVSSAAGWRERGKYLKRRRRRNTPSWTTTKTNGIMIIVKGTEEWPDIGFHPLQCANGRWM